MNNRSTTWMIVGVILSIVVLLSFNTWVHYQPEVATGGQFLSRNQVRGIEVVHKEKPFTLNFEQQNAFIDYINSTELVNKSMAAAIQTPADIEKIIIYLFDAPEITLTTVGYLNSNLLLSVPKWNPEMLLLDRSQGSFKTLISETYDP